MAEPRENQGRDRISLHLGVRMPTQGCPGQVRGTLQPCHDPSGQQLSRVWGCQHDPQLQSCVLCKS